MLKFFLDMVYLLFEKRKKGYIRFILIESLKNSSVQECSSSPFIRTRIIVKNNQMERK